jgi:hypothetical protein
MDTGGCGTEAPVAGALPAAPLGAPPGALADAEGPADASGLSEQATNSVAMTSVQGNKRRVVMVL